MDSFTAIPSLGKHRASVASAFSNRAPVMPTLTPGQLKLRQALISPARPTTPGMRVQTAQARGIGTAEEVQQVSNAVLDLGGLAYAQQTLLDKLNKYGDTRRMFLRLLDAAGATELDACGFADACTQLGVPVPPGMFYDLFRAVDLNGDGLIDYNDIVGFVNGKEPVGGLHANLAAGSGPATAHRITGPDLLGTSVAVQPRRLGSAHGSTARRRRMSATSAEASAPTRPVLLPAAEHGIFASLPSGRTPRYASSFPSLPVLSVAEEHERELALQHTLASFRAWIGSKFSSPCAAFLALRSKDEREPVLRLRDLLSSMRSLQYSLPTDHVVELFSRYASLAPRFMCGIPLIPGGEGMQPGQLAEEVSLSMPAPTSDESMPLHAFVGLATGLVPVGRNTEVLELAGKGLADAEEESIRAPYRAHGLPSVASSFVPSSASPGIVYQAAGQPSSEAFPAPTRHVVEVQVHPGGAAAGGGKKQYAAIPAAVGRKLVTLPSALSSTPGDVSDKLARAAVALARYSGSTPEDIAHTLGMGLDWVSNTLEKAGAVGVARRESISGQVRSHPVIPTLPLHRLTGGPAVAAVPLLSSSLGWPIGSTTVPGSSSSNGAGGRDYRRRSLQPDAVKHGFEDSIRSDAFSRARRTPLSYRRSWKP